MSTPKQLTVALVAVAAVVSAVVLMGHSNATLAPSAPAQSAAIFAPVIAPTTTPVGVLEPEAAAVPPVGNAVVVVSGKAYPVEVHSSETLLEAMQGLKSTSELTFTGRDYSGLGFFVDSLGGVLNASGKYWVYYVNGVSATKGVSTQTLTAGDRVEWKYEKGY